MASAPSQHKRFWRSIVAFGLAATSVSLFVSTHLVLAQSEEPTSDDIINMMRSIGGRFSKMDNNLNITNQSCGINKPVCPQPPPPEIVLSPQETTCRISCSAPRDVEREQLSGAQNNCVDTCLNPPVPPAPPRTPDPTPTPPPPAPVYVPPPAPGGFLWVNGLTGSINYGTPPAGWRYDPLGGTWGPATDPFFGNVIDNYPAQPAGACGSECQYCKTMCQNQKNICGTSASCTTYYNECVNVCNGK